MGSGAVVGVSVEVGTGGKVDVAVSMFPIVCVLARRVRMEIMRVLVRSMIMVVLLSFVCGRL